MVGGVVDGDGGLVAADGRSVYAGRAGAGAEGFNDDVVDIPVVVGGVGLVEEGDVGAGRCGSEGDLFLLVGGEVAIGVGDDGGEGGGVGEVGDVAHLEGAAAVVGEVLGACPEADLEAGDVVLIVGEGDHIAEGATEVEVHGATVGIGGIGGVGTHHDGAVQRGPAGGGSVRGGVLEVDGVGDALCSAGGAEGEGAGLGGGAVGAEGADGDGVVGVGGEGVDVEGAGVDDGAVAIEDDGVGADIVGVGDVDGDGGGGEVGDGDATGARAVGQGLDSDAVEVDRAVAGAGVAEGDAAFGEAGEGDVEVLVGEGGRWDTGGDADEGGGVGGVGHDAHFEACAGGGGADQEVDLQLVGGGLEGRQDEDGGGGGGAVEAEGLAAGGDVGGVGGVGDDVGVVSGVAVEDVPAGFVEATGGGGGGGGGVGFEAFVPGEAGGGYGVAGGTHCEANPRGLASATVGLQAEGVGGA